MYDCYLPQISGFYYTSSPFVSDKRYWFLCLTPSTPPLRLLLFLLYFAECWWWFLFSTLADGSSVNCKRIRANYGLEWEIKIYCTTFSPFTFLFNHRISNFPPFFTNLWKKDFFSLLLGFEPGPPGWQSTMLATRPGSHDIQNCQVLTTYSNFLQILWL